MLYFRTKGIAVGATKLFPRNILKTPLIPNEALKHFKNPLNVLETFLKHNFLETFFEQFLKYFWNSLKSPRKGCQKLLVWKKFCPVNFGPKKSLSRNELGLKTCWFKNSRLKTIVKKVFFPKYFGSRKNLVQKHSWNFQKRPWNFLEKI